MLRTTPRSVLSEQWSGRERRRRVNTTVTTEDIVHEVDWDEVGGNGWQLRRRESPPVASRVRALDGRMPNTVLRVVNAMIRRVGFKRRVRACVGSGKRGGYDEEH